MPRLKRKGSTAAVIDYHVGGQIRALRILRGLSQQQFADMIGITHQQEHKYEQGVTAIPAGRLFEIALALKTPISFFYEGLGEQETRAITPRKRRLLSITRNFSEINEEYQEAICLLARLMARK